MSEELLIKKSLLKIKKLCEKKKYILIKRKKNLQTLFDLELSINDVISAVLKLRIEDYIGGPECDYDGSDGQIWKFRHPVAGYSIYIKIKFWNQDGEDRLKILSFHPEEY